jgi:hypothetical protein
MPSPTRERLLGNAYEMFAVLGSSLDILRMVDADFVA